jgi:hypothetical protein
MGSIAVLIILLALSITSAEAATDASAFSFAELNVPHTDFSAVRTVSDNYVLTPDLNFKGKGEITGEITTNGGGGQFSQGLYFSAGQNGNSGLYGMSSRSSLFTWGGATKIKTDMKGTVSTFVYNPLPGGVVSECSGFSIASPGNTIYDFSLSGGHTTVTNAVTSKFRVDPMEYTVALDIPELDLDQPADLLSQDVKLDYMVDAESQALAYYGYDFQRDLSIGDIDCQSSMDLVHTGN